MLFIISKQSFPQLPGQQMPMTGVISGLVTPKDYQQFEINKSIALNVLECIGENKEKISHL